MRNRFVYILCLLTITSSQSFAGGMEIPELGVRSVARGGAIVAGLKDPTAAILNPGALSKIDGIMFSYSHNLMWVDSSFARWDPDNEGAYLDAAENEKPFFPLGLLGALSYDLGTDHSTVALTVNGPSSSGRVAFPEDSSATYLLTELDTLLIYYGASYAYGTDTFGFGATIQYVHLPRLNFGIVVDANPGPPILPATAGAPSLNGNTLWSNIRADLRLKDQGKLSAIIGGWWRPVPNIEIGLAGRPMPIALQPSGDVEVTVPENLQDAVEIGDTTAKMALDLPAHARFGIRYRQMEGDAERFDIEFDALFEQWSSLKRYNAELDGTLSIDLLGLGGDYDLDDVVIDKNWKDTMSLRLGGSYWMRPGGLELMAGGFWETGAAPPAYAHLDFPSDERLGYGLGIGWYPSVGAQSNQTKFGLTLAFSETYQRDVNVAPGEGRVYQQRPLFPCPENCDGSPGVAANEGLFKTQFRIVSLGLSVQGL